MNDNHEGPDDDDLSTNVRVYPAVWANREGGLSDVNAPFDTPLDEQIVVAANLAHDVHARSNAGHVLSTKGPQYSPVVGLLMHASSNTRARSVSLRSRCAVVRSASSSQCPMAVDGFGTVDTDAGSHGVEVAALVRFPGSARL